MTNETLLERESIIKTLGPACRARVVENEYYR